MSITAIVAISRRLASPLANIRHFVVHDWNELYVISILVPPYADSLPGSFRADLTRLVVVII